MLDRGLVRMFDILCTTAKSNNRVATTDPIDETDEKLEEVSNKEDTNPQDLKKLESEQTKNWTDFLEKNSDEAIENE